MAAASNEGILIGDKLYSGVLISLENCLIPEEKCSLTASMLDGLGNDTETDLRCVGCELIQSAGILLRLPQVRVGRTGGGMEGGTGGIQATAGGWIEMNYVADTEAEAYTGREPDLE